MGTGRGKGDEVTTASRMEELKAELSARCEGPERGKLGPTARRTGDTPKEAIRQRLDDRERLQQMQARGEIKLGTGTIPDDFWSMPRPEDPDGEVMRALLDERQSSR